MSFLLQTIVYVGILHFSNNQSQCADSTHLVLNLEMCCHLPATTELVQRLHIYALTQKKCYQSFVYNFLLSMPVKEFGKSTSIQQLYIKDCKQFIQCCTSDDVKQQKLEIWGKAQRESARRCKSDCGKLRGGKKRGENFSGIKVTWPELKCIGIRQTCIQQWGQSFK